jgi:hypothetical protein
MKPLENREHGATGVAQSAPHANLRACPIPAFPLFPIFPLRRPGC